MWWKGGHNSISDSQFLFDSGQILELIFEIKGELVVLQWKGGHNSISDSQSADCIPLTGHSLSLAQRAKMPTLPVHSLLSPDF